MAAPVPPIAQQILSSNESTAMPDGSWRAAGALAPGLVVSYTFAPGYNIHDISSGSMVLAATLSRATTSNVISSSLTGGAFNQSNDIGGFCGFGAESLFSDVVTVDVVYLSGSTPATATFDATMDAGWLAAEWNNQITYSRDADAVGLLEQAFSTGRVRNYEYDSSGTLLATWDQGALTYDPDTGRWTPVGQRRVVNHPRAGVYVCTYGSGDLDVPSYGDCNSEPYIELRATDGTLLDTIGWTHDGGPGWVFAACGDGLVAVVNANSGTTVSWRILDTSADALVWVDIEQTISLSISSFAAVVVWDGQIQVWSDAETRVVTIDTVSSTTTTWLTDIPSIQEVVPAGWSYTLSHFQGESLYAWTVWGPGSSVRYLRQRQGPAGNAPRTSWPDAIPLRQRQLPT